MNNDKRLIEVAFPLKQASIDSVHEKNVRHGHISTLHIWPARRPLAASRAALIATLLPDPGDKEKREDLLRRLGGTLKKTLKKKKMPNGRVEELEAMETDGGVLHWGNESNADMQWFRQEIRQAYGGRAPRVLDPFAGGGAIPFEAMRLGCDVTAVDLNPVAWFVLKCTLDYPQRLGGQMRRLPDFALRDPDLMAAFLKARGHGKADIKRRLRELAAESPSKQVTQPPDVLVRGETQDWISSSATEVDYQADLAWHLRAWGRWVLRQARRDLCAFYPTYAEYCTLSPYARVPLDMGDPIKLVPTCESGELQVDLLNAGLEPDDLDNPSKPRWVAKPTVAYLWARTVYCKACRAQVPLLKTRWLVKKGDKRVVLNMSPREDKSGVDFTIDVNAKSQGGNGAQRREYDKRLGQGTMSRAGVKCPMPGCGTIMTMEDLRLQGRTGNLGCVMTAVVVDGANGKEYRLPRAAEIEMALLAESKLKDVFDQVPLGLPKEAIPLGGSREGGGSAFTAPLYGLDQWHKLFTPRQLIGLASLVLATRRLPSGLLEHGYPADLAEAISALAVAAIDRVADRGSAVCHWDIGRENIANTFSAFRLPISWDFAEGSPTGERTGSYLGQLEWIALFTEHAMSFAKDSPAPSVIKNSAMQSQPGSFDLILTDPPYYDAIPYSDLMDFFYVWLRRSLAGLTTEFDAAFKESLSPKWNHESNDGELIDDSSRFGGNKEASKRNYEAGMARAFKACLGALNADGRLVVVFAHKHPDAWETLVAAIIQSGFVVDGSWPIQTEMGNRTRALSSAALSSSVWLVCKKRDPLARAGWDTQVLKEMEDSITTKLRDFWDAGIRGPDFIWAATGPALESYSRYPAVKKASEPGALMSVTDFLSHVRRIVVDFVVGRVLSHGQAEPTPGDHPLDDVTTYYLLHRNDFGLKEAPAGPCILYAVSCGISERELADQYELLARSGGAADVDDEAPSDGENDADEAVSSGGGKYKLRDWRARKHRSLGMETSSGRAIPLIDQVHKLMHLWVAGDVVRVNDYLDSRALRRSQVFAQLIQALIEKSRAEICAEECSLLERLQNYLRSVGSAAQAPLELE